MLQRAIVSLITFSVLFCGVGHATTYQDDPATEWEKKQNSDERLQAYGEDILGDGIDPHLGALSFNHTDISLPGNSNLEVALRRSRGQGFNFANGVDYGFADWDLETPRIEINLPDSVAHGTIYEWDGQRCSTSFDNQFPDAVVAKAAGNFDLIATTYRRWQYSNGVQLKVPGHGSQQLLEPYPGEDQFPATASHVTTKGWQIECHTISAGVEGFIAIAPNGDRYRFDKHVTRDQKFLGTYQKYDLDLQRDRHFLFASEVTDVNGNWVRYIYDSQGRLTKIHANDGREITLTYQAGTDLIATATANGRTWSYSYRQSTFRYRWRGVLRQDTLSQVLSGVTQPDGRSWSFDLDDLNAEPFSGAPCIEEPVSVSLTHPYGMTGTFKLSEHRHRQSIQWLAPQVVACDSEDPPPNGGQSAIPNYVQAAAEAMSVTEKKLVGPNYPEAIWTFDFEEDSQNANVELNTPARTNWSVMTDPNGNQIKYFHYWNNEPHGGKLFKKETYDVSNLSTPIEVTEKTYLLESQIGNTFAALAPIPATMRAPGHDDVTTVTRGSDIFTTDNNYDWNQSSSTYSWGFPTQVVETSSVAPGSRTINTTYEHNTTKWILGLPKIVTRNGKEFDRFTFDSLGRMTEWKQFGVTQREVGYHTTSGQAGMVAWVDDALNKRYTLNNYKRGTPQQLILPNNVTLSRVVDNNGWITSFTNGNGDTTGLEYNSIGWRTKLVPPKNDGPVTDTVISYAYTSGITQTVTQGNFKKTVSYDALLREYLEKTEDISVSDSARYTRTGYDSLSNAVFQSFPSLNQTAATGVNMTYDVLKRPLQSAQSVAPFATTTTEYLSGYRVKVTDPRGNITTTTFDAWGAGAPANPAQQPGDGAKPWEVPLAMLVDVPLGADMSMSYDSWGNVLTQSQGGAVTTSTYDNSLRLSTLKDPDNYTSYTYYDAANRPIVTVDGEGRKIRTVYDDLNRPLKTIKAWAGSTNGSGATLDCNQMRTNTANDPTSLQQCYRQIDYTPTGQTATVRDANNNITKYTYDALDRLTHTYFPSKTTPGTWSTTDFEQTTYNGLSQVVSKRTRRAQIITYTNNALGQLLDRTVPGAPTHTANGHTVSHSYTYDVWGNIFTATHDGETLGNVYDAIGRITSQSYNGANAVSYEWDAANNLTKLTWPNDSVHGGFAVDYQWDANNRVTQAVQGGRILASVAYDALSRRQSLTYANGSTISHAYTNRGDLTDHDLSFAGSTAANYDYTYNGVGQMETRAISNPAFNWLPLASETNNYSINGLNQYTSIDGASPVYDGNGNLTNDTHGRTFAYDAENVLRTASGLAQGTATYRYHADGSRRSKTYDGVTTESFYMGGLGYLDEEDTQFAGDQEIAEYVGGTLNRRFIRLPGSVDETFLMIDYSSNPSGDEFWAHQDRLGSVVATTDSTGAVIDKYRYSPYGKSGHEGLNGGGAPFNGGFPFRFTGQKLDAETGLYYYKARYYDPETGRFLQTDPIGYEDQMNLYAYVANDPVNFTDPAGLAKCGSLEGDNCETALDASDSARDTARASAEALRGVAAKVADGKELSSSEQERVDAVTSSFGDKYGSADKLNEVAGALDGVADQIGARGEGLVLNKGNERNPGASAYVDGPNAAAFNQSFFDKGSTGRQITVFHEATHIRHGTLDKGGYRATPQFRRSVANANRDPSYFMTGTTDAYTCSIVAYNRAEC